ncbi:MAG: hypothetical protein WC314_10210 [Vulcanimicrobiota bacterium]
MESFLDQMKQEGQPESEGGFTLSAEGSHWKMAQYCLANRGDYPAHVLAAAVAGGASKFSLEREARATLLSFDGAPISREDLLALSGAGGRGRLHELSIALSAAAGQSTVRVGGQGVQTRHELQVVVGEATVHEIPVGHQDRHTFLVEAPLSDRDLQRFLQWSRHAPLELWVDGVKENRALEFGASQGLTRGVWEVKGPEPLATGPLSGDATCFYACREAPEGPSLLLCLVEPRWSGYPEVLLLSNGVVLASEANFFEFLMLTGAVTTSHLKRDLSSRNLIKDEAYEVFLHWLQREVDRFLCAFAEKPPETRGIFDRVFKLELGNRYKAGRFPKSISEFLDTARGLEVTQDKEKLDDAVLRARKTGSEVYLDRLDTALLFEVEKRIAQQDWKGAGNWNQAHLYLRGRAGRSVERNQAIDRWFKFITEGQVSVAWAQESMLDIALHPSDRYRSALMLLPHESWKDMAGEVDQINVSDSWKEPLRLLGQEGGLFNDPSWALMRELLYGSVESFIEVFNRIGEEMSPTRKACFLELVARALSGNLPWSEQIKLTALRSTSWVKTPSTLKKEFFAQLDQKKKTSIPPPRDSHFFRMPASHELHLPILVYQCWLLRGLGAGWQKLVLARTLLIESLRSLNSETELGEELPPRPF